MITDPVWEWNFSFICFDEKNYKRKTCVSYVVYGILVPFGTLILNQWKTRTKKMADIFSKIISICFNWNKMPRIQFYLMTVQLRQFKTEMFLN